MTVDTIVTPVTADRWDDLVALFGPQGAYSECWCMYFRVTGQQFARLHGPGARQALRELVADGRTPGLLAYRDGRPVGWCSLAPRGEYGRVLRSPTVGPKDELRGVWSVVCFFVARRQRGSGIVRQLLDGAVRHAADRGARAIEGYPLDLGERRVPAAEAYVFAAAGFDEVTPRRSAVRPVMRRMLG